MRYIELELYKLKYKKFTLQKEFYTNIGRHVGIAKNLGCVVLGTNLSPVIDGINKQTFVFGIHPLTDDYVVY